MEQEKSKYKEIYKENTELREMKNSLNLKNVEIEENLKTLKIEEEKKASVFNDKISDLERQRDSLERKINSLQGNV